MVNNTVRIPTIHRVEPINQATIHREDIIPKVAIIHRQVVIIPKEVTIHRQVAIIPRVVTIKVADTIPRVVTTIHRTIHNRTACLISHINHHTVAIQRPVTATIPQWERQSSFKAAVNQESVKSQKRHSSTPVSVPV